MRRSISEGDNSSKVQKWHLIKSNFKKQSIFQTNTDSNKRTRAFINAKLRHNKKYKNMKQKTKDMSIEPKESLQYGTNSISFYL